MPITSPRAAIMAVFAAFGAMVGVFAGSVPQIIANYSLNNTSYGFGITVMTAATIAAMSLSGLLARHVSHRNLLLFLLPAMLVLLAALLTGQSAAVFFLSIIAFGMATGVTDVIMNAEGGQVEVELRRPVYTAFHGAVSLSAAVFAITSSILSTRYGTWASLMAASVATGAAIILVWRNIAHRRLLPLQFENQQRPPLAAHFTLPLVLIGLAAGLVIASEITAMFWSSKLLADMAPQTAEISGLGAAFFGLCNAFIRFPGDRLRARIGDMPLMRYSILIAVIGFAGLGLTGGFAANVFFFALTGMGLALICPCLFAMAARQTPMNRAAGLSVSMLVAGVPRIVAPAAFGAIAEALSIRLAFGLCAAMLLCAFAVISILGNHSRRTI
ncbi:MAG: MFS transporter [Rhizobiaceae bacterium]